MNKDQEFLIETANTYTLTTRAAVNRGFKNSDSCFYLQPNGNRCAIGRILDPANTPEWVWISSRPVSSLLSMRFDVQKHCFPQYHELSNDALSGAQSLHDNPVNWDETGLSKTGWMYLLDLLEKAER